MKPFLDQCHQNGIYLSCSKTHGGQEVEYAGLSLSATEGCKPSMEKYKALQEITAPSNLRELRSFLGICNYLGQISPDLRMHTVNMRKLLKKKNSYVWTQIHQQEFEMVKLALCADGALKPIFLTGKLYYTLIFLKMELA